MNLQWIQFYKTCVQKYAVSRCVFATQLAVVIVMGQARLTFLTALSDHTAQLTADLCTQVL